MDLVSGVMFATAWPSTWRRERGDEMRGGCGGGGGGVGVSWVRG